MILSMGYGIDISGATADIDLAAIHDERRVILMHQP